MAARIVAISGKSGCGNSTVSRLLSDRLGVQLINYTFRRMAGTRASPSKRCCGWRTRNPTIPTIGR